MTEVDRRMMGRAIELARDGLFKDLGGPFGCVIAKEGAILGEGNNRVTSSNDPTAHAEIVAIRRACETLGHFQLDGCTVYTTCEPCPMCLGAIYWSRAERIFIAANRRDAAEAGFDDEFLYRELSKNDLAARTIPVSVMMRDDALDLFRSWIEKPDKVLY